MFNNQRKVIRYIKVVWKKLKVKMILIKSQNLEMLTEKVMDAIPTVMFGHVIKVARAELQV